MEEQRPEGTYKVTYTYPDGQIERVQFYSHCTLEDAERWSPHMQLFEQRLGLKRSISQVDDAVLSALLDLSGMASRKPCDADVYAVIIDEAVDKEKHEKVIDLTKPRPRAKPSSKRTDLKFGALSEKKPEKVFDLKPRCRVQPSSGGSPSVS